MLTDFLAERKKFVFPLHGDDSMPIGQLLDAVIDPDTGLIKAWWVLSFEGLRVIVPEDIVEWNSERIVIQQEHDLNEPEKLPRLQKFFSKEVSVVNASVWLKEKRIGSVQNFGFDTISPRIMNIYVHNGWWMFGKTQIISAKVIEKITKKGVFISQLIERAKDMSVPDDLISNIEPEAD